MIEAEMKAKLDAKEVRFEHLLDQIKGKESEIRTIDT